MNSAATVRRDSKVTVPFRTVLISMVALWAAYFALTTLRSVIIGVDFQEELLIRRFGVCVAGVLVTAGMWLVLRFFDNRSLPVKSAAAMIAALPAALLIAQINQAAFAGIQDAVFAKMGEKEGVTIRRDASGNLLVDVPTPDSAEVTRPPAAPPASAPVSAPAATITLERADDPYAKWRRLTDIALGRYFLLLAWGSLYLALLAGAQARAAERREGQFRDAAKASELRSLRYQVNPHLLFNALNSLSSLVMTGKSARAEAMIQTMASFYRHSLAEDPTSDVELAEEFDLQRHYLSIEEVRFPGRLTAQFDLPPPLASARVPGMILQPLVENSVKYAVALVNSSTTITIAAFEEHGRLVIAVADDGTAAPGGAAHGLGIGLTNVSDRLKARFGAEASINSGPVEGGYRTELRLPLINGSRDDG